MAAPIAVYNKATGRYEPLRKGVARRTIKSPYTPKNAEWEGVKTERGYRNRMQKRYDNEVMLIDQAEATGYPEEATISVDWRKGSMGAMQAQADLRYSYRDKDGNLRHNRIQSGRTKGYGYDKESSAVADTFNDSPEFRRLAYDQAVGKMKGDHYSIYSDKGQGIAHFQGGVGMGSYVGDLKDMGYDVQEVHGKNFDVYTLRRQKVKNAVKKITGDKVGNGNRRAKAKRRF